MTDEITKFVTKHPEESLLYDFEYEALLGTNTLQGSEDVSQVAKLGRIVGSGNLTITAINRSGTVVQARIAGGTTNEDYRVRSRVADSQGNTLTIDVIVQVREASFEE